MDEIPAGHHIEESVNGIVSLVKDRPQVIWTEEIQLVEEALRRRPKGDNYRVAAKGKQITVYERLGPAAEEMAEVFGGILPYSRQEILKGMKALLDKNAQYSPMLHFKLVDAARRRFSADRVTYVISLPAWIAIGGIGTLQNMVDKIIPLLDTDAYFEMI